jgi:NhaP-type Na+/H+ or K+/H+ antiporter
VPDSPVVGFAAVVVLGMAAQWLAWRLRLPSILLLLVFGFAAGPGRLGLVDPGALFGDEILLALVSVSAALILFEGGLTLSLPELKAAGRVLGRLVSIGLLVTWGLATLGAHLLVGLPWGISILLGAILTVSGPTVVQPLLRDIRPHGRSGTILKWEGIVIDPIGAVLAVLVFESLLSGTLSSAAPHALVGVALTLVVGGVGGYLAARLLDLALRRYWIPDYLHNPAALAIVVAAFVLSNLVHPDAGLLTVTVLGMVLANRASISIRHIVEFKENLRVLLLSSVFILLAARLELANFEGLGWGALVFLAGLILVVRPLGVWLSTRGSKLDWREKLFLAWMFPRGIVAAAVASVFALELEASSLGAAEKAAAQTLVPMVFLVIVGTVIVYGLTAGPLARRLGLSTPNPQGVLMVGAHRWARAIATALMEVGVPVRLVDTNRHNLAAARMEGLSTWFGSALSEHAKESIDFADLGRLFALTSNDEVNSLTTLHYVEEFGRERIYQLAPETAPTARGESVPTGLQARLLFDADADYWALARRFERGAKIKTTNLTEQFGLEEFQAEHGDCAVPLFTVDKGVLAVATVDKPLKPTYGQTLIALVDEARVPAAEEATDAAG